MIMESRIFFFGPSARIGSKKIGSIKQGLFIRPSFWPSFRLSVSFLGIGSLVFSETQCVVRGPYIVVCDSRIFWKKSPSGKNDQKWPKNMAFGLFKKIMLLVLHGKVLMVHQHFGKTACLGKIWFSSYSLKWLSANEISVFFNRQYFTSR